MLKLKRATRDESGFAMVFVAGAVVMLMAISAIVLDVAVWYSYSIRVQRSADAAALAGVVFMPYEYTQAQETALAVLNKNGFKNTCSANATCTTTNGKATITIGQDANDPKKLVVNITDSGAPILFSGMFTRGVSIHKQSIGAYNDPVTVGSPGNRFGVGLASIGGGPSQYFWASINGSCQPGRSGDMLNSKYLQDSGSYLDCTHQTLANDNYDTSQSGYSYSIIVPANGNPQHVQVYDPMLNAEYPLVNGDPLAVPPIPPTCTPALPTSGTSVDTFLDDNCNIRMNTYFSLYHDVNNTLENPSDDVLVGTSQYGTQFNCTTCDTLNGQPVWQSVPDNLGTSTLMPGNHYRLVVSSPRDSNISRAMNAYALRLHDNTLNDAVFNPCTSDVSLSTHTSSCPVISAENIASTIADGDSGSGASDPYAPSPFYGASGHGNCYNSNAKNQACFYLAEIPPGYAGKEAIVTIFDPDQGTNGLRILDPNFNPMLGKYIKPSGNVGDYKDGSFMTTSKGSGTTWPYDAKTFQFKFSVPADYDCDSDGTRPSLSSCWWYLNYKFDTDPSSVRDRTTWSVHIIGDPVHLALN